MKPSRKKPHPMTPERPLTEDEVSTLIRLMRRHELSVYQRLYAVGLTCPGSPDAPGTPFDVSIDAKRGACVKVTPPNPWRQYAFYVNAKGVENVVARAEALYAVMDHSLVDSRACCPAAEVSPCVCIISFKCPVHGGTCHGSHD